MRRLERAILAGWVSILAACGGSSGDAERGVLDARGKDVVAATCSGSMLAWSDPNSTTSACAGPWEYQIYSPCYALQQASDCPIQGYQARTCAAPQFGVLETVTQSATVGGAWKTTPGQNCKWVCNCLQWSADHRTCYEPGDICSWKCQIPPQNVPDCDTPAQQQIASWNAARPTPYPYEYTGYTITGNAGFSYPTAGTCYVNFTRNNFKAATDATICGTDPSRPIYASCRTAAHGLAANQGECGPPQPGLLYSAPNLSTTQLASAVGVELAPAAKCTTDEPNPFSTAAQAQGKHDRLAARLDSQISADPGLRAKLVQNIKLLFELAGTSLRPDQESQAIGLYSSDPSSAFDCGNAWTPPTVTASCPATTTDPINSNLRMCSEMLRPHVSAAVASLMLSQCRSIDPIKALSPTDCAKDAYLQSYLGVTSPFLAKEMADLTTKSGDVGRVPELQGKLANINAWYSGVRSASSGAIPEPVLKGVSTILDGFWRAAVLNQEAGLAAATSTVTDAQVSEFGLRADSEVLQAAFSPAPGTTSPPLSGGPLLLLTNDGLRGLYTRLQDVGAFHDLGCHFKSCQKGAASTQVSQLWGVLASLADSASLKAVLPGATQVDSAWSTAFGFMQTNHSALEQAVNDAQGLPSTTPYDPSLLLSQALSSLPPPMVALSQLIRDARARSDSYQASGFFVPDPSALKVGLDNAHETAIQNQLAAVTQQLQTTLSNYKTQRAALVGNVISNLANQGTQTDLKNQAEQKLQKIAFATSDLSGLRMTAADDEVRFGDFMQGFQLLLPALNASGELVHTSSVTLNLSAADAVFANPGSFLLADMAVNIPQPSTGPTWNPVQGVAGEQLNIQTSGSWSPTCALSKTTMANGTLNVTGAIAGPEGFIISYSNGSFTAQGVSTADGHSWTGSTGANNSVCMGINISFGTPGFVSFIGGPDVTAYIKTESCLNNSVAYQMTSSTTDTNSSGRENRSSFSFAEGIRSPFAPFPGEPVGSLLVVQVPRNAATRAAALDVRVVRAPTTSVLIANDADVYLVVNDMKSASCPAPSGSSLTVQLTRLTPVAAASQQIATGMANAAAALATAAPDIIAQGRMLPDQATQLRTSAYQKVFDQCGTCTSLSGYPESLRNLFDTWVAKEIVHIEREVEMVNIQRTIRLTEMEQRAIDDDLRIAGSQARLISLAQGWLLRDLDGTQLRSQVQELMEMANDWLAPVINIRYPETLTSFTTAERQLIDNLTNITPSSGIVDLATAAQQALQAVETRLSTVRTAAPVPPIFDVAVSYPRTDKVIPSSVWKKVDAQRATAVWSTILAGGNPVISLRPSDIYDVDGGAARLGCAYSAPVINTIGFFLATPPNFSFQTYNLPTVIGNMMAFPLPSPSDILNANFSNATYLASQPGTLFGITSNAVTSLGTYWSQPGRQYATGLSPFSDFGVDVQSLNRDFPVPAGNPLQIANELIVVMRLEPRPDGPGVALQGVPGCY